MVLPYLKNTYFTFGLMALSLFAVNKTSAQYGIQDGTRNDSINKNKIETVYGTADNATLYDADDLYAEQNWETIWTNPGVYIRNDGGRSIPRYKQFMQDELGNTKKSRGILQHAAERPSGSEMSLDEVLANYNNQVKLQYSTWNVGNTTSVREKGRYPRYRDMGQFQSFYDVVYEDTNRDTLIDSKTDRKISETLMIRTAYVLKNERPPAVVENDSGTDRNSRNGRNKKQKKEYDVLGTFNLTTVMHIDHNNPDSFFVGAYLTDDKGRVVVHPDVANETYEITGLDPKKIREAMDDGVYNAGSYGWNGAQRTAAEILNMVNMAANPYDMQYDRNHQPSRNNRNPGRNAPVPR